MSTVWQWVTLDTALAVHEEQLLQHGGGAGIRDQSLLESALARPQQMAAYTESSVHELAAAYAFGIARNRPFIDGNKRTAWIVARLFLLLHGFDRTADDAECYINMLNLAAGNTTQEDFADWLKNNTVPLS